MHVQIRYLKRNILDSVAGGTDPLSGSSTACFDRHATDEVKKSLASIGDYHMFLIDRAFTKQSDQVTSRLLNKNHSPINFYEASSMIPNRNLDLFRDILLGRCS